MTKWTDEELLMLGPILEHMESDLASLQDKKILVLCSAAGDVVIRFAHHMHGKGEIIGLERSKQMLHHAKVRVQNQVLSIPVSFRSVPPDRIPFPDATFDALVSEFILYPTSLPTQIGQSEMARVVVPGGIMLVNDVIVTDPLSKADRKDLRQIGFDYLCEAQIKDFHDWMTAAGLEHIEIEDLTPIVQPVWQRRQVYDQNVTHQRGYNILFGNTPLKLGKGILYIYAKGIKPKQT